MLTNTVIFKVALMTISLWFMAWTPYLVINYTGVFESAPITPLATIWGSLFAKANAVYNPIVYGIRYVLIFCPITDIQLRVQINNSSLICLLQPPEIPRRIIQEVPIALVPGITWRKWVGCIWSYRHLGGKACRVNMGHNRQTRPPPIGHTICAKAMLFIFIRKHLHMYKVINLNTERVLSKILRWSQTFLNIPNLRILSSRFMYRVERCTLFLYLTFAWKGQRHIKKIQKNDDSVTCR